MLYEDTFPFSSSIPSSPPLSMPLLVRDTTSPPPQSTLFPSSSGHLSSPPPSPVCSQFQPSSPSPTITWHTTRLRHPLAWLHDYVTNCTVTMPTPASQASTTGSSKLPPSSLQLLSLPDTLSYNQACSFPEWRLAMQEEIQALETNNTWEVTSLPSRKTPIDCRWIFKTKLTPDGFVHRYKARLVAKGHNQVEGVDFFDSFSPVAKLVTVRMFLAVTAAHSWLIHQLDINNAFLHGFLDEEVYMLPPPGYTGAQPGDVCLLCRSLYGLKQASRQWNIKLSSKLLSYGFQQSAFDSCLFF